MNKLFLGALVALPSVAALAEDARLAPIVTTPTRIPTSADRLPASVTIISKEEIAQAQANDIGELLRGVPGVDIGRNGGPGQTTSVFLRGTESDHTLIMLDGVPINPGTLGNAAIQNIDPNLVERIEIVRGPLSSLYGSAALGGVINIITKPRDAAGSTSHFTVRGGRYDTLNTTAGANFGEGPWRADFTVAHQDSDGFKAKTGDTFDSPFTNNSVSAGLGYTFGEHQVALRTFGATGNATYSLFGSKADQDFENTAIDLSLSSQINARWHSKLALSRMTDHIDQQQANYLSQYDFAHTTRYRVDWQHDYAWSSHNTFTAGATLERDDVEARSYGTFFDKRLDNRALYLQNQYASDSHSLILAARLTDHDTFGTHITGNLGYAYQLTPDTRLRASAGTAFRAPSTTDLYGFGGNPELEPETSHSAEIGAHHQLSKASSVDVSIYRTRIRDLIVYNSTPARNENIDSATITGLEVGYRYTQHPWSVALNGEWKHPRDDRNDQWLARRARVAGSADVFYNVGKWDLGTQIVHQGERKDSSFNSTVLAAYTLVNATARWHASPNTTLEARLENVFNEEYELAGGYNTPGRSLYLGLRVESR